MAGEEAAEQGAVEAVTSDDLPFTGFPLAIVLLAGVLAVATGLVLRRRGRRG